MQSLRSVWPSWFVLKITAIASLGSVLFGYDSGCIAGALPQIEESLALNSWRSEWVVSTLYVGACFGAVVGGGICDDFGRRMTVLLTDVVFMVGAACLYLSKTYAHIILGRFIVGIAVAVSGIADVSYLHEISPIEIRGAIVSVNEAMISLGFLLAYAAGFVYGSAKDEEWRMIFGWAGMLAFIQFCGMIKMPESPSWLDSVGRKEESVAAQNAINRGSRTEKNQAPAQFHKQGFVGSSSDCREYYQANDHSTVVPGNQLESVMQLLKAYRRQMIISIFFEHHTAVLWPS